ncbi:EboA domain-containing protein [Danxiaibacter flavus]|uniref:EboA domain-containing protein n=1 Tax=Danxiaibacter flavus TaxID=3049108 RepID=A0ABV3ZIB7_9BACT|nr:EboA domain-containing protein [Chitinophagaceae bacterium DXS]
MFNYSWEQLTKTIAEVVSQNVSGEIWNWLHENTNQANTGRFNRTFAAIPSKTGKASVSITNDQQKQIASLLPGFTIEGWPVDRLCRVWLLMQLDATDQQKYFRSIENLFLTADVNEQEALYASLPVLAYPELWAKRCAEGIRSNIGTVLQTIICDNPYPSVYLDDKAWNQLVLKAFFTEKPVHRIIGLDKRNNKELADTLVDYAHERWAAGRAINPQLWRGVGRFINENNFDDIKRVFDSTDKIEQAAAALACNDANYTPAKELLQSHSRLADEIKNDRLTWWILGERYMTVLA